MSQEEHKKHSLISDTDTKRDIRKKETSIIKKIMKYFMIALLLIVIIGGFFTWNYIKSETQPVDTAQTELVAFEIEQGASVKEVSKALEEEGIIRNSKLFNFYLKFKSNLCLIRVLRLFNFIDFCCNWIASTRKNFYPS